MVNDITNKPPLAGATLQPLDRLKKREKTKAFSVSPSTVEESTETQASPHTRATSFVDALFVCLDDKEEGNRQAFTRAELILESLDFLQKDILSGKVSSKNLEDLSKLSQHPQKEGTDPKLIAILQEIETRAQVELAKIENSRKRSF